MPEWVIKDKEFRVTIDEPEFGNKANLLIVYTASNGLDEQVVYEELLGLVADDVSPAELTTRQAAVLTTLNS